MFEHVIGFPMSASKAVDSLLDSKWAKAKKGEEAVFTTRDSVVDYCNRWDPPTFNNIPHQTNYHHYHATPHLLPH